MIEPAPLQQWDRTWVRFGGRKLSYFSGCDYFRLSSHPEVIAALEAGAREWGLSVSASRITTGNHVLYQQLEAELARFFGAPRATLVPSGYQTNVVAAQALAGEFTDALMDENSHPSLSEAARFLECRLMQFKHRDPADLARVAGRCGREARLLVLTDGMFSFDGSAAPLAEYLEVLPRHGVILVDDAHGAGVLGRTGKGTLEHAGVSRRRVIQSVTLSKAFGAYGGAILGSAALRRRIFERSHAFVGSTPLPLPLANAALRSLRLLAHDAGFRQRLAQNLAWVRRQLREAGFPLVEAPGPIILVQPHSRIELARLKGALFEAGIYPPFIKYPTGPASGYFRFMISSEHTKAQLDNLVRVLGGID